MGRKGSWLSAIKRVFTPNSKDKPVIVNDSEVKENKKTKTKKKKKLRHGDTNSFIPLFREPSSIEKIFGDFEREQQRQGLRPPTASPRRPRSPKASSPRPQSPKTSSFAAPRPTSPRAQPPKTSSSAAPRPTSPRPHSPKTSSSAAPRPQPQKTSSSATPRPTSPRPQSPKTSSSAAPRPQPQKTSSSATPRPQSPKARVTSPRAQTPKTSSFVTPRAQPSLRNQNASATRIQAAYRGYMGRKRLRAVKGLVRLQGVVRGQSVKRQTANAMKYMQLVVRVQSQIQSRRIQMLDSSAAPSDSSAGNGNWDDSVLTKEEAEERTQKKVEAIVKRERAMAYAYSHQLWRASPKDQRAQKGFPWWYNWLDRQYETGMETPTPRSSKSRTTPLRTPVASSPFEFPARDNDSLTSCPAFSRPNYMTPTASAKAKSRASGSPFMPATPTDSNRRLSFPFLNRRGPPSSSSFLSPNNNNLKSRPKSVISVGNASVDSTLSMPAAMGRKPFNRFV